MPSHMAWEMWGAESKWKGWADFATHCGSRIERSKAWNQSLVEQHAVYGPLHRSRSPTTTVTPQWGHWPLPWAPGWAKCSFGLLRHHVLGILVTDIQFQMCPDVPVVRELWEVTMPDTGGPYYLPWKAKRNNSIVLWPQGRAWQTRSHWAESSRLFQGLEEFYIFNGWRGLKT